MTHTIPRARPAHVLLEDVTWLLEQGVHPAMIAKQLNITARGIHKAAWRHGNEHILRQFAAEAGVERTQKRGTAA